MVRGATNHHFNIHKIHVQLQNIHHHKNQKIMAITYNAQLQSEYQRLFDTCEIKTDKYPETDGLVAKMLAGQSRYQQVAAITSVPWYVISLIHCMEGSLKFSTHLHNGDPLTARTVQVPAGLPKTGSPPFTWEFSAQDALHHDGMDVWTDWSIPGILYKLEGFNGYAYHRLGINSPYLWSYSNQYTKGKFVKDGVYSATAVSKQCGAAVLLRRMIEKQIVAAGTVVVNRTDLIKQMGADVLYNPSRYVAKAEELQRMLNLNSAHIRIDGKAGQKTSDAYKAVSGKYLSGDPQEKK